MNMMSLQDLMQAERQLREFRTYATDERILKMLRKQHRDVYDEVVGQAIELVRENYEGAYDDVMQSLYDEVARREASRMQKKELIIESVSVVEQSSSIAERVGQEGSTKEEEVVEYGTEL